MNPKTMDKNRPLRRSAATALQALACTLGAMALPAAAAPDGYTLLFATMGSLTIVPSAVQ